MIRLFSNKMLKFYMIVIVLFLFNIKNADSANWYMDKNATGSGNGRSWDNAVSVCIGPCELGGSPGDTWYISGGTTSKQYDSQISIVSSGITIKPGAAETPPRVEHSGTVIVNSPTPFGIRFLTDNVTVDGLINGSRKIKITGASRGIDVGSGTTRTGALVRGVEISNSTDVGIMFYQGYGEIDNCYIHSMGTAAGAAIRGLYLTAATNYGRLIVHDSITETPQQNTGMGADGIQSTNGLIAYNNFISSITDNTYIGDQHADAIQQTGYEYTKIYNNTFTGFSNFSVFLENSRNHIQIYNNYFYKTRGAIVATNRGSTGSTEDFHIYNNTIVDCTGAAYPAIMYGFEPGVSSGNDISIKNNIVVNCASGIQIMIAGYNAGSLQCGTEIAVDKNISPSVTCRGTRYLQPTYGSTLTPSFVLYNPMAGALNKMNLAVSDTVAKDRGENLSSIFTTDKEGISRPQGPGWDIGAYDSISGGKISMPPTNIKIQ